MTSSPISERIASVSERIQAACRRAGRSPADVQLVAVTKTLPSETIHAALEAGLKVFGENYIQEARAKIEEIGPSASWHFIGHLQTNKAKYAVKLFDLIHSVDSLKLARELDKRAESINRRIPILIQVNISEEESKSGVDKAYTADLAAQACELPNLEVRGLMTMPPFFDQPEKARPYFKALREVQESIGSPLTELSMGMSGDFEVAIEEGATIIRVGTAIFGPRA
ncbi:MAG: YggS family pyridoxal phosphate-dependent enzyme [Deltaproteobacteria bacterium]|nr:YggS family pyridoxal phosphate-dependent enzyme [Deltaproteobacteria bacterium]MBW2050718.1 YggS family pyridoxal phosphate-dependent enzyme [Deltaproteobacteria bacterium]MBW2139781.1 YggS family pyridoxal phosphate-dependent enzyme [Deltaproteobacteria bacterium]MBW2322777.1 YggS family pyridoxal phosphate-dependent enzyme [Deltaproteobacteria bacterium]